LRKQIDVAAQDFAHAALDAIAFVRLAQNLADGKADARAWRQRMVAMVFRTVSRIGGIWLRGEKPTHGCGLPFAGGRIYALEIRMFTQTRPGKRMRSLLARLDGGAHGIAGGNSAGIARENESIPAGNNAAGA
jgi:hypothetical protein